MQLFFVNRSEIEGNRVWLTGQNLNHMKQVLRMRPGEDVRISDGEGGVYLCCLNRYEEGRALLDVLTPLENDTELPARLVLFQGLPKGDKMDWIIQKAVELGVYAVVPFSAKRSVVRLDEKKAGRRQERWQTIARAAAEQSGRGMVPEVLPPLSFDKALEYAGDLDLLLIPYEMEKDMSGLTRAVRQLEPGRSVGIFIGPEGGFETEEVEQAVGAGAVPVSLGKRILRTETAGLMVLSVLMYHLESRVSSGTEES